MNPVKGSLRYPQVTLVLTLAATLLGIHALMTMPRREDPKITIRTGLVIAIYPGASPEQVEKQVSEKIEERLFRFEEVRKDKTFSTSRPSLCVVQVELEDSVKEPDVFWSKLRHAMIELKLTTLPDGVQGPMVDDSFGDTVALLIALHGGNYSYQDLKDYARRIEDEFRTSRAVSRMQRFGEQQEQILITSTMERLSQYSLTPAKVIGALRGRNVVQFAGDVKTVDGEVPLSTSGLFETENQIRHVMIDMAPTGQPVYIGDLADVERVDKEPSTLARFNGERALLLSVEMQEGNNIVEFGKELRAKLARLRTALPPDLKIDLVADQPAVVEDRITHFIREFGIAIGSVILVTMLLLPFRVALIASLAIPVTVAGTFATLNALGVELHQVSIAALIVVLGMVVDDAIVIADNYVELLDQGVTREVAAWRCASDLTVPVLTATATIVFAFLPMLLISGNVGEFIQALPIAVAVSLSVSFVVAMLLTPLLCRFFIRKGLHDHSAGERQHRTVLDRMQSAYNRTIVVAMRHKSVTVLCGAASVAVALVIIAHLPQRFFPTAERPQFVIDLWLPEGARLEATDAAARRVEEHLSAEKLVANYSTFVGRSAPRFYYNISPEFPADNYAQILVNTSNESDTPPFVYRLRRDLEKLAPEARVIVKELEQGEVTLAPIEVRITGPEFPELKRIGASVEDVLNTVGGSEYVFNNYREDSYALAVDLKHEVAERLGLNTAGVSLQLGGGFSGLPVTTFWEGDRDVPVVLRLKDEVRRSFDNVADNYVVSALTGARVPLRAVADLRGEWRVSRIVRRNGVRTLTVVALPDHAHLASAILKAAEPEIAKIPLPAGYRISYGGERQSQASTFGEMNMVMALSVTAIFLILLFQFRSVSKSIVIMISIPLSFLGAAAGLWITRNPFSFTAFMGVISLSGVVVRNAIILVEYIDERRAAGVGVEEAALEAGERRLRPIFLTTAAAAVGVTPMILSGSSLWSPLASAIAVGLLFSMFFTLIVVPVAYVLAERQRRAAAPAIAVVLLMAFAGGQPARAQDRAITIDEAVDLALKQNAFVKLGQLKVTEAEKKRGVMRANYYPQVTTAATAARITDLQSVLVPAGALGTLPVIGRVPGEDIRVFQGLNQFEVVSTSVVQPLTQLIRIRSGNRTANQDVRIAGEELRKARNELAMRTREAYLGLLLYQRRVGAAQAQLEAGNESLREARDAVASGNALAVRSMEAEARVLQSKNNLMAAQMQVDDLRAEFNDLLGLPLDTRLTLVEPDLAPAPARVLDEITGAALARNPEVKAAEETVIKARHAISAARAEYIPDLGVGVDYFYQNGVPLMPRNSGVVAARLTWTLFDGGRRSNAVGERQTQLAQAEENARRIRTRLTVDLEKSCRKVERLRDMVRVAEQALAVRREARRLAADQVELGLATPSVLKEAEAALTQAQTQLLEARVGMKIAEADLDRLLGSL